MVSETFDVIVFNDPYEHFHKKLVDNELSYSTPLAGMPIGDQCNLSLLSRSMLSLLPFYLIACLLTLCTDSNYTEQAELRRVVEARAKVQAEIVKLQERYTHADDEITRLSNEVSLLQQCLYASSSIPSFPSSSSHPLPNPISATNASVP